MSQHTAEALQIMMNRGFIVYEDPSSHTWTLQKIPTGLDSSQFLPCGKPFIPGFASQGEAMDHAMDIIEGPRMMSFVVEVQSNDGLGPRFDNLGTVEASSVADAEATAREMAGEHFGSRKLRWCSRVRPA